MSFLSKYHPFNFILLAIFMVLFIIPATLWSQVPVDKDSVIFDDDGIDIYIEDAISDLETDESTDWTFYTDYLNDLKKHPLDLNRAIKEELLMLPGVNEIIVSNLLEHIRIFGNLTTIYELQAVEGMTYEIFMLIVPYVVVKTSKSLDINPGNKHSKGPSFRQILQGNKSELLMRMITVFEEQKGFTDADTSSTGKLTSRYLGPPQKVYMRFRSRYNQNFSVSLLTENDAGEAFKWNKDAKYYGMDFYSGHVFLKDFGHLKRLVVGDYNLQTGQGMLLSTGLGFGKGSETINSAKRSNVGIKPYSSVNENQFLRGAAATVAFGDFYFTGFYSNVGRDANIIAEDTITSDIEAVSSLQTSGLHRTIGELIDRKAIKETTIGGRVEFQQNRLTIGTTHFVQKFNTSIFNLTQDYQQFNFQGAVNQLNGIDFDYTIRNFNFFGEFARSKSGGTGLIVGILSSLHPKMDLTLLFRKFDKDFHSSRGYVFAERPTAVQNETGIYMGIKIKPNNKWTLAAYFDQFWFPWSKFNVSYPSTGHEYLMQLDYKPSRSTLFYVRYKSDTKERNAKDIEEDNALEYLVTENKKTLRFHFQKTFDKKFTFKTRFENSWFERQEEEKHKGFMVYQDIVWKAHRQIKISARYAIFDVPDYDSRIYAYENDILGYFSIPPYSGQGTRYYVMLNYKPVKGLEFWFRLAQWNYRKAKTVGSGLDEIQGNTKTELKIQARISF